MLDIPRVEGAFQSVIVALKKCNYYFLAVTERIPIWC